MTKNNDTIQFGLALKFIVVVMLILFSIFGTLSFISTTRNQLIAQKYTEETKQYISKNQQNLEILFDLMFSKADYCNYVEATNYQCRTDVSKEIRTLLADNIENVDTLLFVKYVGADQQIISLSANGYINQYQYYAADEDKEQYIRKLLNGQIDELRLDTKYYGKTVILPVKKNNTTIGAIIRPINEED